MADSDKEGHPTNEEVSTEDVGKTYVDAWRATELDVDSMSETPGKTIVPPSEIHHSVDHPVMDLLTKIAEKSVEKLEHSQTLGEGGMGIVRQATQSSLQREIAVKALKPDRQTPENILKLVREAWVTGSLEHPNIVPIYDIVFDTNHQPLIVLKKITGTEWGAVMHDASQIKQRFGTEDWLEWNLNVLLDVCNAVQFAHDKGFLHRDLKPENVMIGSYGEVLLMDWGIAVRLTPDPDGRFPVLPLKPVLAGTPCYMAPEMFTHTFPLSIQTDIYLLGAILYEIVTGQPPHNGKTIDAIVISSMKSSPTFPIDLYLGNGVIPKELIRIVCKAMAPVPEERYSSVEQFRESIQSYLKHRVSQQLAEEAQLCLRELETLLRSPTSANKNDKNSNIYDMFGESRFGFQSALRSWKENETATQGLRNLFELMARYELERGDSKAALHWLSETTEADPELRREVEEAVSRDQERLQLLEKLEREQDREFGWKTRNILGILMAVTWIAAPLFRHYYHTNVDELSNWKRIFTSVVALGMWSVLAYFSRASMFRTAFNRVLLFGVGMAFVSQITLDMGAIFLHLNIATSETLRILLWSILMAMVAFSFERRFTIGAIIYALAFLLAAYLPHWHSIVMAAANFCVAIIVFIVWAKPRTTAAS
jgi:eukaryotic-like serine/threonine-protein kinase